MNRLFEIESAFMALANIASLGRFGDSAALIESAVDLSDLHVLPGL